MNVEETREKYINAAVLHRQCSYNGDHKTANKQYKILKNIYQHIEQSKIDKLILLDLLENDKAEVRSWAAAHLLGLKFETSKAEFELQKMADMPNAGMLGFSAEMTLKVWRNKGYLMF